MSITISSDGVRTEQLTDTDATGLDLYGDDKTVVAVRVNGELRDLHRPLPAGARWSRWPSTAQRAWPSSGTRPRTSPPRRCRPGTPRRSWASGPPITDGFYYDFDLAEPFTPEDLRELEKAMTRIIKERQRFRRRAVSDDEARAELAHEPYKLELIADKGGATADDGASAEVGEGQLTIYDNLRRDDSVAWKDLCRGPHVPHTGYIPAFALTRNAAAYWRGDQNNQQLQRLVRHGLAEPGGAQGLPDPARRGGEA